MANKEDIALDPSRRIRASLGEEFTANVEADALERIVSQANLNTPAAPAGSAIRNDSIDVNQYMSQIVHTNPVSAGVKPNERPAAPVTNLTRENALKETCEMFNNMNMPGRSVGAKILMKATGYDRKATRAQNITNTTSLITNITSGVAVDYIADVYAKKNKDAKSTAISGLTGAAIDFTTAFFFSGNKDTIEGLYDRNNISSAEADIINKTIRKEKAKYAIEHTAAGFVAPFALTKVLDKVLPESAKANPIVSAATSFGAMSSVGKLALQGVRLLKDNKEVSALDGTSYAITAGQPCEAYELIAKYSTRRSINGQVDATIYGNVGCVAVNTIKQVNTNKELAKKLAEKAAKAAAREAAAKKTVVTPEVKPVATAIPKANNVKTVA